jgi:LmbE family N-acetylglucosaminyl deacetylase
VKSPVSAALHRLRPLVPPSGWSIMRMAKSFSAGGPLLVCPSHRRALVLAPHPDDEVLGCGGTVILLHDSGAQLRTLIATDGDALKCGPFTAAEVGRRRREEARRAAVHLGTPLPMAFGFPDAGLTGMLDVVAERISEQVAEFQPQMIFAPWPLDDHPDHQALSVALAQARVPPSTEVWAYEVWTAVPANRLVDITEVFGRKEAALAEHRTPAQVFDTSAHLALQRWRSIHGLAGRGYVEAFLALTFPLFSSLASGVELGPGAGSR